MSDFEKKILKKIANKIKRDLKAREKWERELYDKYLKDNKPREFDGFIKRIQDA